MRLICTHCHYRFETKKDTIPRICPYCGQRGTLEKEKDAESLLHEALDEFGDEEH